MSRPGYPLLPLLWVAACSSGRTESPPVPNPQGAPAAEVAGSQPAVPTPADKGPGKPVIPPPQPGRRVAVLVGINDYDPDSGLADLRFAGSDVEALAAALWRHGGFDDDDLVVTLTSAEQERRPALAPSRANVLAELASLQAEQATTVYFVYSGHGGRAGSGGDVENLLFPADYDPEVPSSALGLSEVLRRLRGLSAETTLVVMDACRTTGFAGDLGVPLGSVGVGHYFLFASGPGEVSYELPLGGGGRGLLSDALSRGFAGEADGSVSGTAPDGVVDLREVLSFVPGDVTRLASAANLSQKPRSFGDLGGPNPVVAWRDLAAAPPVDGDPVPADTDACPWATEDVDGYADADGCPDPDDDLDGFADAADACPREAETWNRFEDEDGCPDRAPAVPLAGELPTPLYARAGQPDRDAQNRLHEVAEELLADPHLVATLLVSGDDRALAEQAREALVARGIPASRVRVQARGFFVDPRRPTSTAVTVSVAEGLPPQRFVWREPERMRLHEVVLYEGESPTFDALSQPMFDELAQVLRVETWVRVRVEVHERPGASPEAALALAQRRADAIRRYLVSKRIPARQVEAVGLADLPPAPPRTGVSRPTPATTVEVRILD